MRITSGSQAAGTYLITVLLSSQPFCNRSFTPHLQSSFNNRCMQPSYSPLRAQVFACWNWKCALLSATARSLVYLAALARSGPHGQLAIILVEIGYVALTAGVYAGLQQRALALRSRLLGNLIVAFGVPALGQVVDWLAHRAVGAPVPLRAMVAVSIFAGVSALFHLFVMRRGVFLTGHGRTLGDDFRRIPRLIAGFVAAPVVFLMSLASRSETAAESEAAL
jgi:hypothetical protein